MAAYPQSYDTNIELVCTISVPETDRDGAIASLKMVVPSGLTVPVYLRHIAQILSEYFRFAVEEVWLASAEIDLHKFMLETGKDILHGHGGRKVVFSQAEPNSLHHMLAHELKGTFIRAITEIGEKAIAGERIMIVIVAHGSKTGEVGIGWTNVKGRKQDLVIREEMEAALSSAKDGVDITILTTACFSGLWTIPFDLLKTQPTVLAASLGTNWFSLKTVPWVILSTATARRAISLGDLTTSAYPVIGPSSTIAAFCGRVENIVKAWPSRKGVRKGIPVAYYGQGGGYAWPAHVLGLDDPCALLWKVEGIRALASEDRFTTIALGVETFKRQRLAQPASSLADSKCIVKVSLV
ncbi:hypothetical protein BGX38DRAFT_1270531 [Terfezia claveryi]|nr:hypothetical protein BGX38DRAFT_1270531 [Terfezia claveryi]